MIPALLIRMCNASVQSAQKRRTEAMSASSSGLTSTASFPVEARISSATADAASGRRTASVTAAPADASVRAVSMPIPEAPPVTRARFPTRSTPRTTSAAVVANPNGVVMRFMLPEYGAMIILIRWTISYTLLIKMGQ
jgi:hypothetical protein